MPSLNLASVANASLNSLASKTPSPFLSAAVKALSIDAEGLTFEAASCESFGELSSVGSMGDVGNIGFITTGATITAGGVCGAFRELLDKSTSAEIFACGLECATEVAAEVIAEEEEDEEDEDDEVEESSKESDNFGEVDEFAGDCAGDPLDASAFDSADGLSPAAEGADVFTSARGFSDFPACPG